MIYKTAKTSMRSLESYTLESRLLNLETKWPANFGLEFGAQIENLAAKVSNLFAKVIKLRNLFVKVT